MQLPYPAYFGRLRQAKETHSRVSTSQTCCVQLALWLLAKANATDKSGLLELASFTCSAPHLDQSPFDRGKAEDASHLAAVVSSPGAGRGASPACTGCLVSRLCCQVCFKVMFYTFAKIKTVRKSKTYFFSSFPFTRMIPTIQGVTWMARTRAHVSQRKKASHGRGESGQKTEKLG